MLLMLMSFRRGRRLSASLSSYRQKNSHSDVSFHIYILTIDEPLLTQTWRLINAKGLLRVQHDMLRWETGSSSRHDNRWMPCSASAVKICLGMKAWRQFQQIELKYKCCFFSIRQMNKQQCLDLRNMSLMSIAVVFVLSAKANYVISPFRSAAERCCRSLCVWKFHSRSSALGLRQPLLWRGVYWTRG